MNFMYIFACTVIILVCMVGILSNKFQDTLLQRISMCGIVSSAAGFIHQLIKGQEPRSAELFVYSAALFSIATAYKLTYGRNQTNP